jgi:hypothetical protein
MADGNSLHHPTRVGARELAAARDPADGGALVEQVRRVEVLHTLLHDHAHAQDLALDVVAQVEIQSNVRNRFISTVASSAKIERGQSRVDPVSTWGLPGVNGCRHRVNPLSTWGQPGVNRGRHGNNLG